MKIQDENSKFLYRLQFYTNSHYNAVAMEKQFQRRNRRLQTMGRYPYIMN